MIEPFSNGLVTSQDPSLLGEGELQRCDDCTYSPYNDTLWSAAGRRRFSDQTFSNPIGLQFAGFDGGDDVLVIQDDNGYHTAKAGITGSSTPLGIAAPSEYGLQLVHFMNNQFILDGASRRAIMPDGTTRPHGLLPVVSDVVATIAATGGIWDTSTMPINKYYRFWITEVYKTDDVELEGTNVSETHSGGLIQTDTSTVNITRPTLVNTETTHWRVYATLGDAAAGDDSFPVGIRISPDIPYSETSYIVGEAETNANYTPTSYEADLTYLAASYNNWGLGVGLAPLDIAQIGTITNIYTLNGSMTDPVYSPYWGAAILSDFNMPETLPGTVSSISVRVVGESENQSSFPPKEQHFFIYLAVTKDAGLNWSGFQGWEAATMSDLVIDFRLGPDWFSGYRWTAEEISNDNFQVGIIIFSRNYAAVAIDNISVDIVYGYSGTEGIFPIVDITEAGVSSTVGRNNIPPYATTGDIIYNSLVCNDIDHPNWVQYSTDGSPDYFNEKYYLPINTSSQDIVTLVKALGGIGIIGCRTSLHRLLYLPRETDTVVQRGDATECFCDFRGVAGRKAACTFQMEGSPLTLAGVDAQGPWMTDGYKVYSLTDDLDWPNTVNVDELASAELINVPTEYKLTLFYAPTGSTEKTKALDFHYHNRHIKNGKLKVSGPRNVENAAVCFGTLKTGEKFLWNITPDGVLYTEEVGADDCSPVIQSREMYLSGVGNEWKLDKVLIHHQSDRGSKVNVAFETTKTGANPTIHPDVKSFQTLRRGLSRILPAVSGEGVAVTLAPETLKGRLGLDFMIMNEVDFGVEDSKK